MTVTCDKEERKSTVKIKQSAAASSRPTATERKKLPGILLFVYESLQNNEPFISWVDGNKRKFKVEDSGAIARAWANREGRREGKPRDGHKKPKFEHFGRAMR